MFIIPAIDLMDRSAVRLEQGRRDSAKIYSNRPWRFPAEFAAAGARRLHVVDLDAAFTGGEKNNRAIIARIARESAMEVEVGGGIRSAKDCDKLFGVGVRFVVLGTMAIKDPVATAHLCRQFPGQIIVAVDAREGLVAVEGWNETSRHSAIEIGRRVAGEGAAAVLYTDIGRDGMRTGPNVAATRDLAAAISPCPVIASGGVSTLDDLDAVAATGAQSVVIGKAIYEGVFTVAQAVARAAHPRVAFAATAPGS